MRYTSVQTKYVSFEGKPQQKPLQVLDCYDKFYSLSRLSWRIFVDLDT